MPDLAGFNGITLAVFAALLVLSVSATTVAIYKVVQFGLMGVGRHRLAFASIDAGAAAVAGDASVAGRVLAAVQAARTQRPVDLPWVEEIGRQAALTELARMNRWMRGLEAVVQAAPMLGLLGTVIGMIDAFGTLARSTGGVDPALLAGGIWTALATTAIGLAIALVFYFIAILLEGRIDAERQMLERLLSSAIHGRAETIAAGGVGSVATRGGAVPQPRTGV